MTRSILAAAILAALSTTSAHAQKADATAVGIGQAQSSSRSTAVAVSGQGGGGGKAVVINSVPAVQTVNSNISGTTTQNINSTTSGTTTQNVVTSGTSTVKNVPSVFAPGLTAAGLETCLGSVSGGGAFVGTGFSFGSSIPDPGCNARLDARTLWSFGLRKMALSRLCLSPEIYRADPGICAAYLPRQPEPVPVAVPVATYGEPTLSAGQIWLVEGRTGHDRLCNNYSTSRKKCLVWAAQTASQPVKPSLF